MGVDKSKRLAVSNRFKGGGSDQGLDTVWPARYISEWMETQSKPFESVLEELQKTVKALEGGSLSLEDALTAYEKGVQLIRAAQAELAAAEKRIEILTEKTPS